MKTNAELFDAYRDAVMADPAGSRSAAFERFLGAVSKDAELVAVLAEEWFSVRARYWRAQKGKKGGYVFVSHKNADKYQRSDTAEKEYAKLRGSLRNVILLDLDLPSGKKLRNSTFADCLAAGGFFAEVGKRGKPNQVVDSRLGEKELQNIRLRYFGRKLKKAA